MTFRHYALCAALMAGTPGCGGFQAWTGDWTVLADSAVAPDETIVGRAVHGATAWLMTARKALVRVDLEGGRVARHPVAPLETKEDVWGLAATADGELWTLAGRSTLAQVTGEGRVTRRIALGELHAGVFSGPGALVYQLTALTPGAPALLAGPPGADSRQSWSSKRIRTLPLPRAQALVMNLVSCGASANGTIPCWFPDEHTVTLTDAAGVSRDLTLDGFSPVTPHALLATESPRRPILDAFMSAAGELWVLGSGTPPPGAPQQRRGGWQLSRYSSDGHLLHTTQLPEQARMLLAIRAETVVLLAWNGAVVEARH